MNKSRHVDTHRSPTKDLQRVLNSRTGVSGSSNGQWSCARPKRGIQQHKRQPTEVVAVQVRDDDGVDVGRLHGNLAEGRQHCHATVDQHSSVRRFDEDARLMETTLAKGSACSQEAHEQPTSLHRRD